MLNKTLSESSESRGGRRRLHCEECTIQIGDGYQESMAFPFVDDDSATHPRIMKVCWRCWESLNRRKTKRLAKDNENGPGVSAAL